MKLCPVVFSVLLIKLITLINPSHSNEILGCGGFIKSHAEIDFSKVEVKLLTKQGSIKDKTDCSPSNGYYFLPVYDKGEYTLKISPPPGWSFEPEQFQLNFNGETDICSQGKDVNFVFKGFGITGKVALAGQVGGAKAVNIELFAEDGKSISKTITDINGIFSFTPIIPGKYKIKATHNSWHFAKSEHAVEVKSGNTELSENSLVVSGFDVIGKFETKGQAIGNIGIALFKANGQNLVSNCGKAKSLAGVTSENANYESLATCYAEIDKKGNYVFSSVAPGKYLVRPVVENKDLKIHIVPKSIELKVLKDTLQLDDIFEISGLSVSGRILLGENSNQGLAKATVKVNGNVMTSTNSEGIYSLENIKPGSYKLEIEADNLQFTHRNVKIDLSNSKLPPLYPSAYKVCGKVVSDKSYVVGITKHGSTFHTTTSSKAGSGEWCTYMPSGKFSIEVLTTETDKSNGIQFFPVKQSVEVKSSPISGITFSQLRATLLGEIKCLPDAGDKCNIMEVTLHALDSSGTTTGSTQISTSKNGKYSFKDILPGPYELTIPHSNLCFESNTVLININSAEEKAPVFVHKGYEVSFISSHAVKLVYSFVDSPDSKVPYKAESAKLLPGVNTFCVNKSGDYLMKLMGCHLYADDTPTQFSTNTLAPITFAAIAHRVGFRILAPVGTLQSSLKLEVVSKISGKSELVADLEYENRSELTSFRFETDLKTDEEITITPLSKDLLFKPQTQSYTMPNDCVDIALSLNAIKGLIIQGKIASGIKDVKIVLTFPNNPELQSQETVSGNLGSFTFGPIDESLTYELTAEKESYVFSDYDRVTKTFKAHKLCEIIVSAKDEEGNKLSGVLLSLSGSESYRKNMVTGDNGYIKFHSLSPSQYFLRPMMKEYKFTPNSKMIDVKDGETVEVEIVGNRVAYSVFGTITSLNGDSFPNVNIEAISDEKCLHHQEEASSESNGQYRIRGLKPDCTYTIKTKRDEANSNVERSIPSSRTVHIHKQDIKDVNLIGISPINFVDVTASVFASNMDHYKSLRIQLYRKGNADSPIYSQRVESPLNLKSRFNPGVMVFFPRIPLDGKTYYVELKTSISEKLFTYTLPVEPFVADTGSVYVKLNFKPEIRSTDHDLNQNSISALVLVALVAIAFCRQDLAMDFLNFTWTHANSLIQGIIQKQAKKQNTPRHVEPINYKEIEQLAEGINSIKKKKTKKI